MLILLFVLLSAGALASRVRVGSLYLGSLGALLVGIVGGAYGVVVPQILIDVAVLLLIFVLGAQAGPRFIRTFRKEGLKILSVALISVGFATCMGLFLSQYLNVEPKVFLGAMTGGLSSAAALAALLDSLSGQSPSGVILGYSASYPLSTILVLFIVPLFSLLLRNRFTKDEHEWIQKEALPLERRSFLVTNKILIGKRVTDIEPMRVMAVNISRLSREGIQKAFSPDIEFALDDLVTAVGEPKSLDALEMIFGVRVADADIDRSALISSDTFVTSFRFAGKTVQEIGIQGSV